MKHSTASTSTKTCNCGENCACTQGAHCNPHKRYYAHGGNAVYSLGMIGTAVYYITTAATFGAGVLGVLKAIVWPAFLVYYALQLLVM